MLNFTESLNPGGKPFEKNTCSQICTIASSRLFLGFVSNLNSVSISSVLSCGPRFSCLLVILLIIKNYFEARIISVCHSSIGVMYLLVQVISLVITSELNSENLLIKLNDLISVVRKRRNRCKWQPCKMLVLRKSLNVFAKISVREW